MDDWRDIVNRPDRIYFTAFADIIKPPPDVDPNVIDVEEIIDQPELEALKATLLEEIMQRFEALIQTRQLTEPETPTPALYLGRRVEEEKDRLYG